MKNYAEKECNLDASKLSVALIHFVFTKNPSKYFLKFVFLNICFIDKSSKRIEIIVLYITLK